MNTTQQLIIKYRISSLGIINYTPSSHIDENVIFSQNDVVYNLNYGLEWLNDSKEIVCNLKVLVFSKNPRKEILSSTIRCIYYIDNYNEVVNYDENGNRYTNTRLLEEIFSNTISTARGIIYVKTRTAPQFENILVPTMDVKEMIKKVQDFPEGDGSEL